MSAEEDIRKLIEAYRMRDVSNGHIDRLNGYAKKNYGMKLDLERWHNTLSEANTIIRNITKEYGSGRESTG